VRHFSTKKTSPKLGEVFRVLNSLGFAQWIQTKGFDHAKENFSVVNTALEVLAARTPSKQWNWVNGVWSAASTDVSTR
jgi:hypothetical protein